MVALVALQLSMLFGRTCWACAMLGSWMVLEKAAEAKLTDHEQED